MSLTYSLRGIPHVGYVNLLISIGRLDIVIARRTSDKWKSICILP